ncbi:MAG: hypothetical protein WC683_12505 [bacterium]
MSNDKTHPVINRTGEVMTREKFIPLFEDIKELIKSSAKGTEVVLGKRIGKVEEELRFTQQALKSTKEELKSDIADVRGEMNDMETRLRTEIKDTAAGLADKIDSIHVHIDDHETRITALETPGH